jgi:glycyl-tRNA synthetase beta chain
LKGNGLETGDVAVKETEKGSYVFASKKLESGKTVEIIPGLIENLVQVLPFPKRMKWSDKKVTFPRPIRYFLLMFNDQIIPFEIEGLNPGI